jgi:hypothetical protein
MKAASVKDFLFVMALFIGLTGLFLFFYKDFKVYQSYISIIGRGVVCETDTFIIRGISHDGMGGKTFILSNGLLIDKNYASKHLLP